jgi:hypothetical protein
MLGKVSIMVRKALVILLIFLGSIPWANAMLVDYSDSSSGTLPQSAAMVDTMSVPQFNTDLGTLNSVSLVLGNNFNWTFMGENTSNVSTGSITHKLDMDLAVNGYASHLLTDELNGFQRQYDNLPVFDGMLDFGGISGYTEDFSSLQAVENYLLTGTDMMPFLGNASVEFVVFGSSLSLSEGGNGNEVMGVLSNYSTHTQVVYDYTPVPIPGAWILLCSGLIGLIGLRRR